MYWYTKNLIFNALILYFLYTNAQLYFLVYIEYLYFRDTVTITLVLLVVVKVSINIHNLVNGKMFNVEGIFVSDNNIYFPSECGNRFTGTFYEFRKLYYEFRKYNLSYNRNSCMFYACHEIVLIILFCPARNWCLCWWALRRSASSSPLQEQPRRPNQSPSNPPWPRDSWWGPQQLFSLATSLTGEDSAGATTLLLLTTAPLVLTTDPQEGSTGDSMGQRSSTGPLKGSMEATKVSTVTMVVGSVVGIFAAK